jgi:hypothetical protein
MWRALWVALAIAVAGCAGQPPSQMEMQAKQFQPLPDKSVIYIVRSFPDFTELPAPLVLGDAAGITTYAGTFIRWEVPPGSNRIAGYAGDSGQITLNTRAGGVYYVRQMVSGWRSPHSTFQLVTEPTGQAIAMRGTLIPVQ